MTDEDSDPDDDVAGMYEDDETVGPGDVRSPDADDEPESSAPAPGSDLSAPTVEPGGEPEEVTGTFYVKHAEEISATLHEVNTAQICTLTENPGFERHDIVRATLKAQPPMGVSYLVEELLDQYAISVEHSEESPTKQVRDVAVNELDAGDAVAIEREGNGEIHVLRVEPGEAARTAEELLDDEMTHKNAARYAEVSRVEIRTDDGEGVVSIRYVP